MGEEERFAPGYRFISTKEELIEKYLKGKDSGNPLPTNIIKEVEFYKHQPAVLHKRFPVKRIKSRYFFTKLDKRSKTKKYRDRKAKNGGHWICSTGDKPVLTNGGQYTGGVYKTLTYYEGNGRSKKTGWIMIEYRLSKESKQHQPTANQVEGDGVGRSAPQRREECRRSFGVGEEGAGEEVGIRRRSALERTRDGGGGGLMSALERGGEESSLDSWLKSKRRGRLWIDIGTGGRRRGEWLGFVAQIQETVEAVD
ncbi:NAC transcription factor NAM-B2-like [Phoenix dactylifera]|uniref:NAC transcription factor NAM-B2-like n=1 Tax=Phoenix dactylifera TaxID=42345 RepID=A0A8B8ZWI1_PHODC|nr:NAC transcription factor NAM-B2-like [Phoenix dactylifera]